MCMQIIYFIDLHTLCPYTQNKNNDMWGHCQHPAVYFSICSRNLYLLVYILYIKLQLKLVPPWETRGGTAVLVEKVRETGQSRCSLAVCRWRGKWSCLFKTLVLPSSSSAPTDCFFFPWNHLSSISLPLSTFIFLLAPDAFYTHVSICMSSHIWRIVSIKTEEGNTEEWIQRE